jgi:uncharacterized Zn finger protein
MNYTGGHIEKIKCMECGEEQDAEVLHTHLYNVYIHTCVNCGELIMESEWTNVQDNEN